MVLLTPKNSKIMKQTFKYIFMAAAAIAALACTKEAGIETPAGTIIFKASLEQPLKADLNGRQVVWTPGDKIAVSNGSTWAVSAALTQADIENGGMTASFSVDIAAGNSYTAIYPASARSTEALPNESPEDAVMIELPAFQVITPGKDIDPGALVQIASSTSTDKLVFKNVTTLIKFEVPVSGVQTVFVEALNDSGSTVYVAGTAPVVPEPGYTTGSAKKVTLKGDFEAGQSYYAAVLPKEKVKALRFGFAKPTGGNCEAKAVATGTSAAGFALPANGIKVVSGLPTNLNWFDGTINSKADLDAWASMAHYYNAAETVTLGADIDYAGGTWTPVNANEGSDHFAGLFDGNGHSIYNIVIEPNSDYAGFFSLIVSNEPRLRVKNLTLGKEGDNSLLDVAIEKCTAAGGLCGRAKNAYFEEVVNNIPVSISVGNTATINLGGIAANVLANVEFTKCVNNGAIVCNSGAQSVYNGGITGVAYDHTVFDSCVNNGRIAHDVACAAFAVNCMGGILGRVGNTTNGVKIIDCVNYGTVETTVNIKASQLYFGGICGMDGSVPEGTSDYNSVIAGCRNEGAISCFNQSTQENNKNPYTGVGGIMGRQSNMSLVDNCVNLGTITKAGNHSTESCYGGIIGMASNVDGYVTNCVNGAPDDDTKGLVTDVKQTSGKNQRIGGIVGYGMRGNFQKCVNYGKVQSVGAESVSKKNYLGGIVGNDTIGKVVECANYGEVTMTGANAEGSNSSVGGLIGLINGSSTNNSTGEGCRVKATVSCDKAENTGIVIGRYSSSVVTGWGTQASPIVICSGSSVNGAAVTGDNYLTYAVGSDYGFKASGEAFGGDKNTLWVTFE